jgi:hypothetical protein
VRVSGVFLLVALLGSAAAASPDPPSGAPQAELRKEKNEPYPPEFRKRVDAAVDRGVEALIRRQAENGSWSHKQFADNPLGLNALLTLACLKGGVKPYDESMKKAFAYMRTLKLERTYSVGVLLMALHAKYAGPHDAFAEQAPDKYGAAGAGEKEPCVTSMTPEDRAWMEQGVKFLLSHRKEGQWGYPHAKGPLARGDLSNTQYALLGLWAASRCGVKVPPEAWLEILEWLTSYQEATGPSARLAMNEVQGEYRIAWVEDARARGFRYRPENEITGSMTTAGLAGLAIAQDELWASRRFTSELRSRTRKCIRDALAWLQENFDVTKNPGEPTGAWHTYYLYGLERAGILSRTRFLGKADWYLTGAEYLLGSQKGDGTWAQADTLTDTAFAVLFLRRSTQRTRNPAITHGDEVVPSNSGDSR